ncbi:MAG TPA: ABC transporter substrate-binding protein [Vicinamibacterales bacterium]|nr:ABC transporter substrate-binding protein [Vicinamibacterales bacterium]
MTLPGGRVAWVVLLAAVGGAACARKPAAPSATTLVVAVGSDPGALNPAVTTSGSTHPITDQIFNGLVGLDEQLQPIPELAERWTVEDGGRAYRFALRPGVTWHDGVPFTSADVKFTFEQALLKYHSRTRAALEGLLDTVETPDDLTAVFRLKRPYGPLLQRLDVVEASIIPKHQYEGHDLLHGEPARKPVGTGPFRFVSYATADRIVLERNPTYFRQGLPGIDRLVFRILPNAASAVAALESGDVDYTVSVPGPDIPRLQRTPGIAVVKSAGGSGGSACQDVLIPNLTRRPFSDLRVRRAIAHAIDRDFIVERVYFGQGQPATGPISRLIPWAYTPDVRQYPHDPAQARKLLDEAGLKPDATGQRVAITFTHGANQQRLGQALREQLKAVGITLNLEMLDFNAAVERVFVKKTFDLGLASFCNGADPEIGVRRVYVSSNIGPYPFSNGASYRNATIDALFDAAAARVEKDQRRETYVEIQRILAEEVPYFWLIDSETLRAHRQTFTGFRLWTGAFAETVRPVSASTPSKQ